MRKSALARIDSSLCFTLSLILIAIPIAGCGRAPSFNILGSFFPAWLICMIAGVVLAAISNRVFAFFKIDNEIAWSIAVYPCLALLFACALWLIFFS